MAGIDPDAVLAALSLEQKASLTSGSDFWHTQPVPDAGLPAIMVADGPHGLRKQADSHDAIGTSSVPATCFPPAVALGSTWDVALVERVGAAIGLEARAARVSVVLGPGVNIKRSPLCGRNFEYVSEDPFVAGRIGAAWVRGVQAQGVGASLKHFAVNNQESDRMRVSADVDERTLREIYLPAFEHIVRTARPWTVMSSYNRLNGTYTSEHRELLTEILRTEWGFDGLVVSDWGAVDDRVRSLAAGLDLEMPASQRDAEIVSAVLAGRLDESVLDAAVHRVLALVTRSQATLAEATTYDVDAHDALAREAATAAAVLLKNDGGILPLAEVGSQRIAVVGEMARRPRYQGAGSSKIVPTRLDNALDAIVALAGAERVRFAPGFAVDGVPDADLVAEAVAAAADADVAVLFLGLSPAAESEGYDRTDIDLPADQIALLDGVSRVNPDVVVVLSNGGVVSVAGWQDSARAVLEGWLLGQAGGRATADLLFGRANPGGRLTETIPLRLEDSPAHLFFPGGDQHVRYGEGIYVGYRHFDTLGRPVAYPFGYGLSYTTFDVADLVVAPTGPNAFDVTVSVTNTGDAAGSEVVAVYVHDEHAAVDRPEQELKGFAKVRLAAGETQAVTVALDDVAFRWWSPGQRRWVVAGGPVEVRILRPDRTVALSAVVDLAGDGRLAPLDARSTVDEWIAHPVGGPLLEGAMAGSGTMTLDDVGPSLRRIVGEMPIGKVVALGVTISAAQLDRLVAEAAS